MQWWVQKNDDLDAACNRKNHITKMMAVRFFRESIKVDELYSYTQYTSSSVINYIDADGDTTDHV